jgi:hypothetical protein
MSRASSQIVDSDRSAQSQLAAILRAGRVYRREDLAPFSTSVDRHLRELVENGQLTKLAQGLYHAPLSTVFGSVPPDDTELVAAFLRDKNFLIFSPSAYNSAGLGTTQLYNHTLVYNHKRHGVFALGNRDFDFRVKPRFPKKLTPEFVFVDALNNIAELAESPSEMLAHAENVTPSFDRQHLLRAVESYGSVATKKRIKGWLGG